MTATPFARARRRTSRSGGLPFRGAGRRTNLALLVALVGSFATGLLAFGIGTPVPAAITSVTHGVLGLALVVLIPWKNVVVRRAPRKAIASLTMLGVLVLCVIAGIVAVLGGFRTYAGLTPMQIHVGAALVAVPLIGWHVLRHHRRQGLRRTDLSRRHLLQTAGLVAGAGAAYLAVEGTARLTGSPAADRRETGSHELQPAQMPVTIWLLDDVPALDPDEHEVAVAGRSYTRAELSERSAAADFDATLDCTNGWYARASWRGVPLSDVLAPAAVSRASSIRVTSTTGYVRTFPASDVGTLWLATELGGRPLTAGHGAPVRLVAPGRRGFWWVKWVASVELSDDPWWWQFPFPTQ
ncbi:MAG: molybdopterin-dependent oxidoreductase [Actinomycetota bacterium]|nr:molybdopterin-dependent oxidoreductase [Actinomycetota bacterium]MDQ3734571.1 molybdopterin-dependent oxidoreductase [Actinomycetota bacterium]